MLSMPVLASMSGIVPDVVSDGVLASTGSAGTLTMPKIITCKSGDELTLTGYVEGSIHVAELSSSGSMGAVMTAGATPDESTFKLNGTTFNAPVNSGKQYIIKYNRTVSNGAIIRNSADKFPDTIKLYLKVLAVDPCSADTLKAAYVELPSFQPSPETTIQFTTDGQLDYSGDLQVDYCAANKALYNIYWCDDDEE